MLINIDAREIKGKLVWQIPKLFLDDQFKYKVSVSKFYCRLAVTPATYEHNFITYLKSDIIDLDTMNTSQELLLFRHDNRSRNQFIKILSLESHSLVLYELENSEFSVREYFTDQIVPIDSVVLQLKITIDNSYGRI